jgi:hypothetical protein
MIVAIGGRYSVYIPPRMKERYEAARTDPDLLKAADEIALLTSRLEDLLRRADTGESGRLWARLQADRTAFLEARRSNDSETAGQMLQSILTTIGQGHADHLVWEDIRATANDLRRTKESERKRLIEKQQMVSIDALVALTKALRQSVQIHEPDPEIADAIFAELDNLMSARHDRIELTAITGSSSRVS